MPGSRRSGRSEDAGSLLIPTGHPAPDPSLNQPTPFNPAKPGLIHRIIHRHSFPSRDLENLYQLFSYPAKHGSLRRLLVLLLSVCLAVFVLSLVYTPHVTVYSISCVCVAVLSIVLLLFIHSRLMSNKFVLPVSLFVLFLLIVFSTVSFPVPFYFHSSTVPHTSTSSSTQPDPVGRVIADGVWCIAYVILLSYAFLPLPLYVHCSLGLITSVVHCLVSAFLANSLPGLLWKQVSANVLLFVSVNLVGLFIYDSREAHRRKLFIEVWKSVQQGIVLHQESDRTNKLLHSCVPASYATEMFMDIEKDCKSSTLPHSSIRRLRSSVLLPKDSHIQYHKCVSVVWVTILGLNESVHMNSTQRTRVMNELFNRFDQFASEHLCLGLNIVGTSYLCVSGLTENRSDHAKCAVDFSLDVIEFINLVANSSTDERLSIESLNDHIKYCVHLNSHKQSVRRTTGLDLSARVGVHTGPVSCGVIGQLRWSFDVVGEAVDIVKRVEAVSAKDRLCITQDTLDLLRGEFTTESANNLVDIPSSSAAVNNAENSNSSDGVKIDSEWGNRKSEDLAFLSRRGISTFFVVAESTNRERFSNDHITTPPTPVASRSRRASLKAHNDQISAFISCIKSGADNPLTALVKSEKRNSTHSTDHFLINSEKACRTFSNAQSADFSAVSERMRKRITRASRDFLRPALISANDTETNVSINYVTLAYNSPTFNKKFRAQVDDSFLVSTLLSQVLLVLTVAVHAIVLPRTLLLLILFLATFAWISIVLMMLLGYRIKCIARDVRGSVYMRSVLIAVTIILVFSMSFVNVLSCGGGVLFPDPPSGRTPAQDGGHYQSSGIIIQDNHIQCEVPQYIYLVALVTMLHATIFVSAAAIFKLIFFFLVLLSYIVVTFYLDRAVFQMYQLTYRPDIAVDIEGVIAMIHFLLCLYSQARDSEWIQRISFLWKQQIVNDDRKLRRFQSASRQIIENILPRHVLSHYYNLIYGNEDKMADCRDYSASLNHSTCKQLEGLSNTRLIRSRDLHDESWKDIAIAFISVDGLEQADIMGKSLIQGGRSRNEGNCWNSQTNRLNNFINQLNQIWTEFDFVLESQSSCGVTKIKSFGNTYVVASGISSQRKNELSSQTGYRSLLELIGFIHSLQHKLHNINEGTVNNITLRAGVDYGDIIAGVIRAKKPSYEIWGRPVDLASIVNKNSPTNSIIVTDDCYQVLKEVGQFQRQGQLKVRDDVDITTHMVIGLCTEDAVSHRDSFRGQPPRGHQSCARRLSQSSFSRRDSCLIHNLPSINESSQSHDPRQMRQNNCSRSDGVVRQSMSHLGRGMLQRQRSDEGPGLNSSQARVSLTPPNSIGSRRKSQQPGGIVVAKPPSQESSGVEASRALSPDLPVSHFRNSNMTGGKEIQQDGKPMGVFQSRLALLGISQEKEPESTDIRSANESSCNINPDNKRSSILCSDSMLNTESKKGISMAECSDSRFQSSVANTEDGQTKENRIKSSEDKINQNISRLPVKIKQETSAIRNSKETLSTINTPTKLNQPPPKPLRQSALQKNQDRSSAESIKKQPINTSREERVSAGKPEFKHTPTPNSNQFRSPALVRVINTKDGPITTLELGEFGETKPKNKVISREGSNASSSRLTDSQRTSAEEIRNSNLGENVSQAIKLEGNSRSGSCNMGKKERESSPPPLPPPLPSLRPLLPPMPPNKAESKIPILNQKKSQDSPLPASRLSAFKPVVKPFVLPNYNQISKFARNPAKQAQRGCMMGSHQQMHLQRLRQQQDRLLKQLHNQQDDAKCQTKCFSDSDSLLKPPTQHVDIRNGVLTLQDKTITNNKPEISEDIDSTSEDPYAPGVLANSKRWSQHLFMLQQPLGKQCCHPGYFKCQLCSKRCRSMEQLTSDTDSLSSSIYSRKYDNNDSSDNYKSNPKYFPNKYFLQPCNGKSSDEHFKQGDQVRSQGRTRADYPYEMCRQHSSCYGHTLRSNRGIYSRVSRRTGDDTSIYSMGSELSRSDPTLNYESGWTTSCESEYDNFRPGMASDEDYFMPEPISDMDIDIFEDLTDDYEPTFDELKNGFLNCKYGYLPLLKKLSGDTTK